MIAPGIVTDSPAFDCRETVLRLWDYLDRELDESTRHAVDEHLARCDRCPPHFHFERRLLDAIRSVRERGPAAPSLRAEVARILGVDPSTQLRTGVPAHDE